MKNIGNVFLLISILVLLGGFSFAAEKLTVQDIIELKDLGFTDDELVAEINKTGEKYELTELEVKTLKDKGVGDQVIAVLKGEAGTINEPPTSAPAQPYDVAGTAAPVVTPEVPAPDATTYATPKQDSQPGTMIPTQPIVQPEKYPEPVTVTPPPAKIPQELVGLWMAEVCDMYGNVVARLQIQYWPNGQYSSYIVANTIMGVQETTNSGMVTVVGNIISGRNQFGQEFSYPFQLQAGGSQLVINMPEWGGNVVFSQVVRTM